MPSEKATSFEDDFLPVNGEQYTTVLDRIHQILRPKTYLEIGVFDGTTLNLAKCKSIAIDPSFHIQNNIINQKEVCLFFQMTSDRFFQKYDLQTLLGDKIDFAFLDGMHLFEFLLRDLFNTEKYCNKNSIIAIHDCIPADKWMAERTPLAEHLNKSKAPGAWTGDVWKVVLILKKFRPDLRILCLDAAPTGLVLLTNLDPTSKILENNYGSIIDEHANLDLENYGIAKFQQQCELVSTYKYQSFQDMSNISWF